MASKDQSSVIRRSNRGRTGTDVKTKTDSGCFVDDDVDKQSNIEKSPPRSKTEPNSKSNQFFNVSLPEQNTTNTTKGLFVKGNSQNAVVLAGEMNHLDDCLNNEEVFDDSQSSRDRSTDDKPKDDFYCLYYSDSPEGSLTRNKDQKGNSLSRYDHDDIGARAEELLQKVKSEALQAQSQDREPSKVDQTSKREPPPVAPKPRKTSKTDDKSTKDPILDELEKLGASVGRDFSDVKENDPQSFSKAVKDLQVAETPEECLNRFDEIQNALLENMPDTLERKQNKNINEESRRKSFPGADKKRKLSDGSNKEKNLPPQKDNTRTDPPKPAKKKFEVKKISWTEKESLQSMKHDSHHKRSHMNDNVKPLPIRTDSYKSAKTEATKRLAERIDSNKENTKKEKKASPAQISKKEETSTKGVKGKNSGSAKRKERLEFRSSRRRLNGDLSSIPEDAVIGVRIDNLDNNAIPLARGEDDLSSDEDDLDKYEEDPIVITPEPSYEEMDFPPPPTSTEISLASKKATVSVTRSTETRVSSSSTSTANQFSTSRNNSQEIERIEDSHVKPSLQRYPTTRSQYSSLSSDGWTSESTAGYSSANDADDEIERQQLETSEDFETYEDPEEIADMTFGTVIDNEEGDRYTYMHETPQQIQRSDIVDKGQRSQRKGTVVDKRISSSTLYQLAQGRQPEEQIPSYEVQSGEYPMEEDEQYEPEYYENEGEVTYYDNLIVVDSDVSRNQQVVPETMAFCNSGLDRYPEDDQPYLQEQQHNIEQRPRNSKEDNSPDPSGFMTVQDIKRLIFQGAKPSTPRSSSFCGAQALTSRLQNEQDLFQRQSWSGYSASQQQHSVIDPLVRDFPQRGAPLKEPKKSPYVRTVVQQKSIRQHDFYSDSNLPDVNEQRKGHFGRSQSFCGSSLQQRTNSLDNYRRNVVREEVDRGRRPRSFCEAPLQRRSNSLEDYQRNVTHEENDRGRRSRSFFAAPLQRRAHSLDNYYTNGVNETSNRAGRAHSFRGLPTQRRSNSLDDYYSSDRTPSSGQPASQRGRLIRSTSDSSSNYSQSDNEQYHEHFSRTNNGSRETRRSPVQQYIGAEELARLLSPETTHEVQHSDQVPAQQPQLNSSQQRNLNGRTTFRRNSSESLRIQALRRASQVTSDSDSDSYVERFASPPNPPPTKQHTAAAAAANVVQRKTLSERFSEVPQRINFDELAEQLNLPSDDEDDDIVDGGFNTKTESDFGDDLEFDYGDYFDDNNMIVGEALRLKKVLGCDTKQDPELETLVSVVTNPNVQTLPAHVKQSSQTDEYLTTERPPPYHEVRKDMKVKLGTESPNYLSPYDTDGSYPSESDNSEYSSNMKPTTVPYVSTNTTNRERRDSEPQTGLGQPPAEKSISTEELLKLILSSSQANLNQSKPAQVQVQQNPQSVVQNLLFPAPQTKAASTGNIHSEKTFPGHVSQLYGNADINGDQSNLNRRRHQTPPPTYHKSQECLRRGRPSSASVLKAKLVSSSENVKSRSIPAERVFEEEVDCMRTKSFGDFSSGEVSSGSSIDSIVEKDTSPGVSVAYIGCEETKAIETLPRVKLSSQRKRRKEKVGFLSDQDIPSGVNNDNNRNLKLEVGLPLKDPTPSKLVESNSVESESPDKVILRKKDIPKIDLNLSNSPVPIKEASGASNADQVVHFPHDNIPSPNSVNVFIDYKKNVMKVTTSTPKIHHGKLITDSPNSLSPVAGSPTEEKKRSPKSAIGQEEFPPRYDSGSSSERSSSVYSSDDEKFFGSCDTVVFVDKTSESQSDKPTVDVTVTNDQEACSSNGHHSNQDEEAINAYSARVDSLLREVRSSLDVDSIGSELLDQAMERVKDKLSPRSPRSSDQAFGGITMEAYVALHQADELQAIINEIKGELQILQEENSILKETVVSLQHGDSRSTSEITEASLTESAERIESIRKQIAAVVINKQADKIEEEDDLINIDVYLRGFGEAVGLKSHKKTDVKLGEVTVKGGADWTGVYDAAKTCFLEHIKRIDTSTCLGLGPTSMYGAQIGATMLTPETLRKKNPRVEISRKFNSCVIQLKDGMTDSFDSLIYDTLIPKQVVESYIHQILEHRFVVLCGSLGIGKTHLATKLAEHLAQRFGSKSQNAVLTLSVGEKSRKELKKTLANLMKCDISSPADGVPVVVILDQLDCLASLADIFEPKQLEGNRNSPFIIGVRNKSKKGPFSSKDLAIHKYFRWIQMSVYDRYMLGLLERFLRRKLSWSDNIEEEEDLLDLFIWLTQVWHRINQILYSYVDVEVTIGPSVFYTCPMDIHSAEGWFANVWNYTIIPYLHQNIRNSRKIYERDVPWEDPTKWVIMRWPWSRERSKVLPTLKKLRQVDIVLNRNNMDSTKESKKESRSKLRKLRSNLVQSPSKAGSLESWSTVDWETASVGSEDESIASSTL